MNIDIGRVLGTSLDDIKGNPVILGPLLVVGILSFLLTLLGITASYAGRGFDVIAILGAMAVWLIIMVVANVVAFGVTACMAAEVAETGSTSLGSGFSRFGSNLGPILVVEILGGLIVFIGMVLCVLPGIVAAFFLMFSLAGVVYGGLPPIEAIKDSFSTVANNLVDALVIVAIAIGLGIAGAIVGAILGFIPILGALIAALITAAINTFILILTIVAYREITG